MRLTIKLTSIFFLLLLSSSVFAQSQNLGPCGTDLGISSWLRDFQSRIHSTPRTDGILYVPLQIHIVGSDEGSGYMQLPTVMRSFCVLNEDFLDAEIQFFLANPVNYIDNSDYYVHDFSSGGQMMNAHNVPNAINCYIVEDPAGNCGYFSPGRDGVALAKSCTQPSDHTWAHEVGHFLSLPHPFYGWEFRDDDDTHDYDDPAPEFWSFPWADYYVEKVDGSNCQFAADGFCDTAPDYLDYRWSCNIDGVSNVIQHDPNGESFVSNGDLFMSYSNDACASRFSDDQTTAMRANIEEERTDLLSTAPDEESILIPEVEVVNVLAPATGTLVEGSSVMIEWEPVENATHYLIQVNPFSIFSIIFNQYVVDEPRLLFTNLQNNRTFYWRIKPMNNYYTCAPFMDVNTFETGTVTAINELLPGESVSLYPNPVNDSSTKLQINSRETGNASWRILDARGRVLNSNTFTSVTGVQNLELPTQDLAAGLYLVQINLGDRQAVSKLIVQ